MAKAKRRLAAILSADVAGYSRLMGDDERATMDTLNAYRDVFRQHISNHDGRVVDTAGDSVLAVFGSVVEAVQCSAVVQAELRTRNQDLPDDRRMLFRIGVNVGDVIEQDDGTIYGDGVNVAARLEALAEPGSVCLSGSAYEQVEGKTDLGFQEIGEHKFKNIARPVRVYRVATAKAAADVAPPKAALVRPDKPSIAVLAFDNLSGDADQEYFADGIVEDLITELTRFSELFVIARNSSFIYKGKPVDIRQIGRDLGVAYVLEGSVRKSGNQVRITTQLIDTETAHHLWAERYDRILEDIFAVQDEITREIVGRLGAHIEQDRLKRSARKPPEDIEAYDLYLQGKALIYDISADSVKKALELLERAVELAPDFALAHAELSHAYIDSYRVGYFGDAGRATFLEKGVRAAEMGVRLAPDDAWTNLRLGTARLAESDVAQFELHCEKALALNPNDARILGVVAFYKGYLGHLDRSKELVDRALRHDPFPPPIHYWTLANYYFLNEDFQEALTAINDGVSRHKEGLISLTFLAMIHAELGDANRMTSAVTKLGPDFSQSRILDSLKKSLPLPREVLSRYSQSLSKAGLPE